MPCVSKANSAIQNAVMGTGTTNGDGVMRMPRTTPSQDCPNHQPALAVALSTRQHKDVVVLGPQQDHLLRGFLGPQQRLTRVLVGLDSR